MSGEFGPDVLVVGLGNPLMEDDGFGSAVIHALKGEGLPPRISAEAVPDILHVRSVWEGQPAVWIVDAVAMRGAPGTVYRFDHEAVLEFPGESGSAHQLGFGVCLRWLLHACPELASARFRLWGAEPAGLSPRPALSPSATRAVAQVVGEIRLLAAAPRVAAACETAADSAH